MKLIQNLAEWRALRSDIPNHARIGFVPTMGNLHRGHQSLFERSIGENDLSVASIFINPTQFNREDDFLNYPKTLSEDLDLLDGLGVDYCLLPTTDALYGDNYRYQIHEMQLSQLMEGMHRPGHFNGVLTVVMKLLQLVKPQNAYFGEKDYQQLLLIQDMVDAFFMDVAIIPCPTIREDSGLAFSSRNRRLTPEQKILADEFAKRFHQDAPCEMIKEQLEALGITVEYIEEHFNRRFIAVMIGTIRLIDNYARS